MEFILGLFIGSVVTVLAIALLNSNRDNEIYMEGYLAGQKEEGKK